MKRGCVYLQYGFWQAVKKLDIGVFGPNAWDLFCVLRRNKVQVEVPLEDFNLDDLLSILWHESGGSCFVEKGQVDAIVNGKDLSIEQLCSVFLLDKEETECNRIARQKGILCLNAFMLSQKKHLVNGKKESFAFKEKGSFYSLKEYLYHPCNSLIIIDPYILKERKYINIHIKHLLANILPQTVEIPFHLSIFSGLGANNDAKAGDSYYDEILNMLREIRPKIEFCLTLYQIPISGAGWHDRFVITNNLMIEASAGFECFGRVEGDIIAQKDAHFDVYSPTLSKNGDVDNYYIQINRTSRESKTENEYYHNRFGVKENRLFDLVE